MRNDAIACLEDIRIAAQDAIFFAIGLDFETYQRTEIVRSAVERKLMIAGEALSQLAKLAPDVAQRLPDWRAIIAFRNILVHGYHTVDHLRVYEILNGKLPELLDAVKALIADMEGG